MSVKDVEVVISGIGAKFPDANNVEEFKEKLFSKSNLLVHDLKRWNPAQEDKPFYSGKIADWNKFDGNFFGMHPKMVRNCDPMHGLILEKSYEAMVDAGINPFTTVKKNISVICATSLSDAELIRMNDGIFLEGLGMVGHSRTMIANRISYCFNLSGPSYFYDSTWSSAMEALDKATLLVAEGAVDGALVVTCGLLAYNSLDMEYRNLKLLAPADTCSPFDAEANGFVRSESVVAVFIQRAQDAKRSYCDIVKTDVLHMGDKPCGYLGISPMIETFLTNFYQNCKFNSSDVSYLETGSVCIKNSDTVELNGVANAFCLKDATKPLLIGSVMGNVGNTEASSGFVSLTKVIIALESGVIPPTINYNTPNPDVPALVSGKLKPVTEPTDLPGDLAATSSIGMCGTVAHVLVKRNNKTKHTLSAGELPADGLPRLILLQARHEEGARAVVDKVQSMPVDVEFISLANDVFQMPVTNYLWRAYAVLPSAPDAAQTIQLFEPVKRPIWFIFTGMGSQWAGMGRELLKIPVFAAAVDKCDKVLRPRGVDVMHILTTDDATIFENILNCFVGISTVQIGLVDILHTLGVTPDGMIGHSAGELGCSYADGCLTVEETVLAAYSRGRASLDADYKDIGGMMAAVGMGYNDIKDKIPASLDVACHNAADSCTLSGPEEDVLQYVGQLKQQGVFAKAVSAGGIAYHSRYIKTAAPKLLNYLKETIPNPKLRSARWVSSSAPEANWDSEEARLCSPEYHTNNLLNPVLFEEACKHLPKDAILIEIAPHGLLQAILKRSVNIESINIALTNRGAESNLNYLLNAVGKLYLNNVSVDGNALFPAVQYPVSRGTPSLVNLVTWNHEDVCYKGYSARLHKLLSRNSLEKIVELNTYHPDYQVWKEQNIDSKVVVPLSHLVLLPWKMILAQKRLHFEDECVVMEDVTVSDQLFVDGSDNQILVTTGPATLTFEVSMSTYIGLTAKTIVQGNMDVITPITFSPPDYKEEETALIEREEVYSVLAQFGWNYGIKVQNIRHIVVKDSGCVARVEWTGAVATFLDQLILILIYLQTDREQSRCWLQHFTKLTVNVPALTGNIKGSEVEVFYDRACNTLVCEGVQLCGPILCPAARHTPLNLSWTETKYQPYYQTKQSLREFWSACLNLVSDAMISSWSDTAVPIQIVFVKSDNEESNDINTIFKEAVHGKYFQSIKPKEVTLTGAKKLIESPTNHGYIVAGSESVLKTMVNWPLVPVNVFFFTYEKSPKSTTGFQKLKPIISYESLERNLHLLKKVTNLTKSSILELDDSNWLDNLRQLMSKSNDRSTTIVVSRSLNPKEVLPILAKEPYVQNIRTVFLLDSNTLPFKLSNPFYYDQLSLGLFVNILYRGLWNSLSNISLNIDPKRKAINGSVKSSETETDVTIIGLNTTYFNSYQHEKEEEPTIQYVDYVGYSRGEKVMGVAQFEPTSQSVTPDPILRWTVPQDWTMEDAATVPVTYAMAYHCMNFEADLKEVRSIFIHAGMSPIGQALVRIALGLDRDVFVSVLNNNEVETIMKLFPSLKRKNILVLEVDNIEINIRLKTFGKGVDLVFNCLQGKHLNSALGIMGHYCQLFNLAGVKIDARESLGLSIFLKNTTVNSVSLNTLARCSDNWKQSLKHIVNKGINEGTVVPFNRKVFTSNELTAALRNLKNKQLKERTLLHLESKRGSDSKDTFNLALIAGTNTDLWLDVAEWLVRRGSRRLIILTDESQLSRNHKRFNKLTKRYDVDAVMASAERLDTYKATKELMKDMQHKGTLSTIVCIGMDENSIRMKNLDAASREVVPAVRQFVSLLGEGVAVSESRARSGLAVCHVRSSSTLQQPALVLPYLAALLDHTDPVARFLTVSDRDTMGSTTTSSIAGLHTCLPSLAELNRLRSIPDHLGFLEVTTLSPGYNFVKHDLRPIFIVPGLYVTRLEPLLKRLIHPAFCCTMPLFIENIDQFAEMLMEKVLQIQSEGPYNIVGDTWGGAGALALGCLLEAKGQKVELFLIDGAPPTLQDRVQALCTHYNADVGSSILANVLNLPTEVVKELAGLDTWEEKLTVGLEHLSQDVRPSVGKPLTFLYHQLTVVQLSKPLTQLFKGRVTLITCEQPSSADLAKLTQVLVLGLGLKHCHGHSECVLPNLFFYIGHNNEDFIKDWRGMSLAALQ